jgi:hypothetical protein
VWYAANIEIQPRIHHLASRTATSAECHGPVEIVGSDMRWGDLECWEGIILNHVQCQCKRHIKGFIDIERTVVLLIPIQKRTAKCTK